MTKEEALEYAARLTIFKAARYGKTNMALNDILQDIVSGDSGVYKVNDGETTVTATRGDKGKVTVIGATEIKFPD